MCPPSPLTAARGPCMGFGDGGRPGGARRGRHSPLAVLQADCGSPVWPARGSSFEAGYCSEMPHGKAGSGGRGGGSGQGRTGGPGRGRGAGGSGNELLASPRPQGTARSPAAPCPAWTASPTSWTASPRGGSPSDTPAPSRRAPASTRGPGRPGRRRPDGPTRRYEGRQLYPANPAANKACYNTAGSPGASLNASPGVTGGGGGPAACAGTGPHPAGLRGLCGVAQICPRSPPAAGTFLCLLWE